MSQITKEQKEFVVNGGVLLTSTIRKDGLFVLKQLRKDFVTGKFEWFNRLSFTKEEYLNKHVAKLLNKGADFIFYDFCQKY